MPTHRPRHRPSIAGLVLVACLAPATAGADIYKFVDADGVVHLADRRLGPGYKLILKTRKAWQPRPPSASARNRARYTPLIDKAAELLELDKGLVHAVVSAESAYDPRAVSSAGAAGLMQLMPDTARRYGVEDRFDPVQNVYAGTRYLRDLLAMFDDVSLAVAAYNAGENAVIRHGNRIPPYSETRAYVRRVLDRYRGAAPPS